MNLNAFPFFASLAEMKAAVKHGVTLKCPATRFLPFQISKPRDNQPIDCINVFTDKDVLYRTIMGNEITYTYHQTASIDFITYYGATLAQPLACGDYYLEISGKYSAVFSVVSDVSQLLTVEWANDNNLFKTNQEPVVLYSIGFLQRLHLEAEVLNPTYPYEETGNENEYKEFVPDFKRVTKQSQFKTVQLPPYAADVLGSLPLHSQVRIGYYANVQGIDVAPDWLDLGLSASVTVKFSEESPVIALGCDALTLETRDVSSYTPRGFMCGVDDQNAYWQNTGNVSCEQVNGVNTGYTLVEQEDINPNSSTYGQIQTVQGISDTVACPVTITYYSLEQSEYVTRTNCAAGYYGTSVLVKVPAGTFTSTVSQQDANNKALAYLNSIKQSEANTNGTCVMVATLAFAGTGSDVFQTANQAMYASEYPHSLYTETGTLETGSEVYYDAAGDTAPSPNGYFKTTTGQVVQLQNGVVFALLT